jgi:predicted Zn-dependent protease
LLPSFARARGWGAAVLVALAACAPARAPTPEAEPDVLIGGRERPAEIVLSTEDRDRAAGEREAEQVAAELGIVEAPELDAYLDRLGRRLVVHAPRRRFDYAFQIVDQDVPNAFALPGGFVYVSRGLLALANSEDELANVLAHEIVHVSARHAAGRQEAAATVVNPLMLPGVLIGAVLGERVGEVLAGPFQILNVGYVARYSREQESEADRMGQQIAAQAGFDPAGLASFLRSLENSERLRVGFSRLPGFLDTHPANPERAAAAAARARDLAREGASTVAPASEDYLRRLEGLLVGDNPREGLIQGDRFLHPDLDFTLRFPESWKPFNTPRAVGALSGRREGEVFLEHQGPGDDPRAAADAFLAELPRGLALGILRREELRIAGLAAHRLAARAGAPEGDRYVEVTWIAHAGAVYRITASAPLAVARRYRGALALVPRSFRPLTPAERDSIRVTRLRLVPARPEETLESLSARSGNAWDGQRTAVMNGVFSDARLARGQLVKVALPEPYRAAARPEAAARVTPGPASASIGAAGER